MDEVARVARERRPKLLLAGWSAYPRQLDFARFREIADEVGALLMVDMAHFAGLVAAGLHPSPVPHADVVTSTTHKTIGGGRGGLILCKQEHAKAIDIGGLPRPAGRAAGARDRRQGGRVQDRDERQLPRAPGAHARRRPRARRRGAEDRRRRERAHRRHRRSPDPRRPARVRARRPAGGGPPARDRRHGQPQRRPVRPAPADGLERPADRHPGARDARDFRRRTSPRSARSSPPRSRATSRSARAS